MTSSKLKTITFNNTLTNQSVTYPLPTKTSDLTNDSGYITSYTETDPTVPEWAKQATKPTYTASEVGAASISDLNNYVVKRNYDDANSSYITNDSGRITIEQSTSRLLNNSKIDLNGSTVALKSWNGPAVGAEKNANVITLTPTQTTIKNIITPTNDGDAANKKYVDDSVSEIEPLVVDVSEDPDTGVITSSKTYEEIDAAILAGINVVLKNEYNNIFPYQGQSSLWSDRALAYNFYRIEYMEQQLSINGYFIAPGTASWSKGRISENIVMTEAFATRRRSDDNNIAYTISNEPDYDFGLLVSSGSTIISQITAAEDGVDIISAQGNIRFSGEHIGASNTDPAWSPTDNNDFTTKKYVDDAVSSIVIPTVPTTVSSFTNDSGYQNSTQVQSAINTAIGNINSFEVEVVSALPTSNINDHTIYFVPQAVNSSTHDEYMYINNNWELIGNTSVDLSGYLQKTEIADWAKASIKPSYTATEVGAMSISHAANAITSADITAWNNKSNFSGSYNDLTNKPTIPTVPTNVSSFTNDAGYLTSFTETDPTVPAWAKAATKPTYTAAEVGALPDTTDLSKFLKNEEIVTGGLFTGGTEAVTIEKSGTNPASLLLGATTNKKNGFILGTNSGRIAGFTQNNSTLLEISNFNQVSIENIVTPTTDTMAANKKYVDDAIASVTPTETDPIFSASVAAGISSTDISNWNAKSNFSGSYNDLTNKPTIPAATTVTNTLASGTLIATINGTNIYAPTYTNGDNLAYGG